MKIIYFSFLALALTLVSCSSDSESIAEDLEEKEERDDHDGEQDTESGEDCLALLFPVSVVYPDGTTTIYEDEDSMDSDLEKWYEENTTIDKEPRLVYPVEILHLTSDSPITVNTQEEMERYEKECENEEDDGDYEDCIQFIYPISFTMPDGSELSIDNDQELDEKLEEWYEDHPDQEKEPALNYPVEFTYRDRTFITNDDEELERYLERFCDEEDEDRDEEDKWEEDCFKFVYPISMTMPDGTTLTGNDDQHLEEAIKEWYDVHPDVAAEPELQFPVQVTMIDSDDIITIENEERFIRLLELCDDERDEEYEDCFEFIFPLSMSLPDGTVITADSRKALAEQVEAWYEDHPDATERPDFVFPLEVKYEDQVITISDQEQLDGLYERCDEHDEGEYDCPELEADFGDDCRLDTGEVGTIDENCECAT